MPFSGDTFTRLQSWTANAAAGLKIRADLMDLDTNDIANGLTGVMAIASSLQTLLDLSPTVSIDGVADGIADDTTAVLTALNSGKLVDGGGLTYAVTGTLQPSSFKGLQNARLKQLAPATSNVRTLYLLDQSNFILRRLTIDEGGLQTAGDMNNNAGIWIDGSAPNQFVLENVRCTNGGPGNGIAIHNATNFLIINPMIDEFRHNVGAIDDVIQGIWYNNCSNFRQLGGDVKDITGVSTVKYTRGYAFGGCSSFSVVGAEADTCDQCFDISGTTGNHDFIFGACIAKNGGTHGFKFANSAYDGLVVGCLAQDIGYKAFVVSGQTQIANPKPGNILFIGSRSKNVGSNGIWSPNAEAFRIESVPTIDASYPRGVRFVGCDADDDQVTPTMANAFACDVPVLTYPTAGYDKNVGNTAVNCRANWAGAPGQAFSGISFPTCRLTGTGTDTVATATWTVLSFNVNTSDTSGMHSASSNNDHVYVKEPGWYALSAQAAFQANSTGLRQLRFQLNGSAQNEIAFVGAHPTLVGYVSINTLVYVDQPGIAITLQAYQDSGISLTVDRTRGYLAVAKVGG